jgi:4-hydroxybenzoate polyprenyltransferase
VNTLLARAPHWWPYLQLVRPANVVTALADVLAGFGATGVAFHVSGPADHLHIISLAWLLLATAGLYAGGITFNDVFDAKLDAAERPERPIPSGQLSRLSAAWLGGALLLSGVLAALQVSVVSAMLAGAIALTALFYDAYGKHLLFGPLNMGACRGLNLMLGVSAVPAMLSELWFLALLPILYIAAITLISRGEVCGGARRTGVEALLLIGLVSLSLLALGATQAFALLAALPFLVMFWWRILPPFAKAARDPRPERIRAAVQAGVMSLIVLNACIAAGFAGFGYGLLVVSLLPISVYLSRLFTVT